jgi:hypothetical protein
MVGPVARGALLQSPLATDSAKWTRLERQGFCAGANQAWKELPQPQDFTAFGLSNVKPRFSIPSKKSTVVPSR